MDYLMTLILILGAMNLTVLLVYFFGIKEPKLIPQKVEVFVDDKKR
jgi:hypothetical protein